MPRSPIDDPTGSGDGGTTDRLLVGVDGCRGGWVAAMAPLDRPDRLIAVEVVAQIDELLADVVGGRFAMVALDMPMGLPESGPRRCDIETRQRLGRRAPSVFPTPPRPVLGCTDHAAAVAMGRRIDGRGISIQAFNLIPKIVQVDRALGDPPDPRILARVVEAHPESAFAELAGAPLTSAKRTAAGRAERLALLATVFHEGNHLLERRHPGAAPDDVLDAAVLVRTAHRMVTGSAMVLGGEERDARGIPMRVVI
ncbi:MAG: DUF429 domain-containing protein [Acidobacteria bacterium]|nr:DUF429 domain-containing protein [Acidobacteriota bacterium]